MRFASGPVRWEPNGITGIWGAVSVTLISPERRERKGGRCVCVLCDNVRRGRERGRERRQLIFTTEVASENTTQTTEY